MTVTFALSDGPTLKPKTDVGVHIIKLMSKAALAEATGCPSTDEALLPAAADLVPDAQKTDIVVFDHRPWHVVQGKLLAHPQVHIDYPETVLKISFSAGQRAVWWSEEPFTITSIRRSDHHPIATGSPDYPFDGPPPPYAAERERDLAGRDLFAVRANPIVKGAIGQQYKIEFFMDETIDPDMEGAP